MLEALLLVRSRDEAWTVEDLAKRLYLPDARVQALVGELCDQGLTRAEDGTVRYAPDSTQIDAMVVELAGIYSRHVVAVTELIHSGLERQARDFADAFRLRRDQ